MQWSIHFCMNCMSMGLIPTGKSTLEAGCRRGSVSQFSYTVRTYCLRASDLQFLTRTERARAGSFGPVALKSLGLSENWRRWSLRTSTWEGLASYLGFVGARAYWVLQNSHGCPTTFSQGERAHPSISGVYAAAHRRRPRSHHNFTKKQLYTFGRCKQSTWYRYNNVLTTIETKHYQSPVLPKPFNIPRPCCAWLAITANRYFITHL